MVRQWLDRVTRCARACEGARGPHADRKRLQLRSSTSCRACGSYLRKQSGPLFSSQGRACASECASLRPREHAGSLKAWMLQAQNTTWALLSLDPFSAPPSQLPFCERIRDLTLSLTRFCALRERCAQRSGTHHSDKPKPSGASSRSDVHLCVCGFRHKAPAQRSCLLRVECPATRRP